MTYQRKTEDEYTLQGDYGYGWEDLIAENNWKDICERRREYRENELGTSFRILKRRVKT